MKHNYMKVTHDYFTLINLRGKLENPRGRFPAPLLIIAPKGLY